MTRMAGILKALNPQRQEEQTLAELIQNICDNPGPYLQDKTDNGRDAITEDTQDEGGTKRR